jgi:transposase, IS30 family
VLRASLTWDQGPEMGKWNQVAVDADIDIFFCDPHAPWQRATNENNGSPRQEKALATTKSTRLRSIWAG